MFFIYLQVRTNIHIINLTMSHTSQVSHSTGYGPRASASKLVFTGEENDNDLWEVRMLAYMGLQDLKTTILPSTTEAEPAKNEKAYAELVMLLDEKSLSMVMNEASDDGRQALEILRAHYKGTGKPRILTLYNNLCNLKLGTEHLTDYISRAERLSISLKSAGETISDSLLIAMVIKGLPSTYDNFLVVITQSVCSGSTDSVMKINSKHQKR